MACTLEETATASVNVVTIDETIPHVEGTFHRTSFDTVSYFASVEDARVAAVAMIAARGWHFTGDWDGNDHSGVRAAFLAGDHEGEIMWRDNEDGETVHVGAIYAFALSSPATITRTTG